jgi:hypothetical protein
MATVAETIAPLQLALLDVLRAEHLDQEARRVATGRILDMTRSTPWPELACRALERVVGWEIEGRTNHVDPVNARLTQMARRGEDPCPRCLRRLPDLRALELERFEAEAGAWDRRLRDQLVA